MLITSGAALLMANFFDLSSISIMGSAGFLLIFAAVNGANALLSNQTRSRRWISIAGLAACLAALGALLWQTASTAPRQLWVLAGLLTLAFAIETIYKAVTKRQIRLSSVIERL